MVRALTCQKHWRLQFYLERPALSQVLSSQFLPLHRIHFLHVSQSLAQRQGLLKPLIKKDVLFFAYRLSLMPPGADELGLSLREGGGDRQHLLQELGWKRDFCTSPVLLGLRPADLG